jgi:hypothetical protein
LESKIAKEGHRSDLSNLSEAGKPERIVQIMRPSLLHQPLQKSNWGLAPFIIDEPFLMYGAIARIIDDEPSLEISDQMQ